MFTKIAAEFYHTLKIDTIPEIAPLKSKHVGIVHLLLKKFKT